MIRQCTCRHPFQDQKYGGGMRVQNQMAGVKGAPARYRCSVCAKVTEPPRPAPPPTPTKTK